MNKPDILILHQLYIRKVYIVYESNLIDFIIINCFPLNSGL
jgi:hypothetical protein